MLVSCKRAVTTEAPADVLMSWSVVLLIFNWRLQELLEPLFKRSRLHDVSMVGLAPELEWVEMMFSCRPDVFILDENWGLKNLRQYTKWQPQGVFPTLALKKWMLYIPFSLFDLIVAGMLWNMLFFCHKSFLAKASTCDTDFVEAAAAAVEEAELRRPVDSQD